MRKWYNKKAVAKIAEISRKTNLKNFWKGLTKEFGCDIIGKLVWKRNSGHKKVFWKNLKKVLDKELWMWYNIKAVSQEGAPQKRKFEKTSEKGVDKWTWMWYNKKAHHQKWATASWKLNNAKSITTLEIPIRESEGQEKTLKRSNNASVIEQDWYFRTTVLIYTI